MWPILKAFLAVARGDFWITTPQPGSKKCLKSRSGGPSAYFTASFDKQMLLGMVKEVNYFLQAFRSDPHSRLQAKKGVPRVDLEALRLTLQHPSLNTCG